MVVENESCCPCCSGGLRYYDSVKRITRTKGRRTSWITIRRLRCSDCGSLHREIPDSILPYKQYEAEIVIGVLENLISSETLGYEDYPCEMTMLRWKARKLQFVL